MVHREAWIELDLEYERQRQQLAAEQQRARRMMIEKAAASRKLSPIRCHPERPKGWPAWERNAERYASLVPAVVAELTKGPIACLTCRGERTVQGQAGEGRALCPTCHGTGLHPSNPRKRGKAIGVSRTAFLVTWTGPYDHLARFLADRMQAAAGEFDRRIRANVRDAAA